MTEPAIPTFGKTKKPDDAWLAKALPEQTLDPDLAIIDPHMHFWDHASGYRYFLDELAADVKAGGHAIEATIFVECHAMYRKHGPVHLRSVGETEFAVGQAAIADSGAYTDCRAAAGIIAFADLAQGALTEEAIDAHIEAANGRLVGIRQRGKWDADPAVNGGVGASLPERYLDPKFGEGLDLLGKKGLAFDASVFHPQLGEVAEIARRHPGTSIVLVHTGSPIGHSSYAGREAETHATWLRGMKEVAACPNVSVKLGGLLMCLGNFDFTRAERPPASAELADLWRLYLDPCLDLFGPERCMVSSNFPVERAGCGYGTIWNMYKRITEGCSPDERALMFSGNARRIYNLPI
ncbi:amidohydrolase family protein [Salipiger sp.]|uniref:amidohydrolase family protein n=1 Tax=Salipiger sp. TaxID=2078585 RepID=UPI003A986CEE